MATQPNDDLEPRRIARSTRRGMEPSHRVHAAVRGASEGGEKTQHDRQQSSYSLPQRVVAKVSIVRHRSPQKGRESLRRHISYLQREAVTRDGRSGRFYDAAREDINAKKETRPWREDRHHFRIILSPEHAADLDDLQAYVRETMRRVERDLGPLHWLAVNHKNTGNFHAHLVIRGRTLNGRDLVIPRDYITRGFRERATEVATQQLGERTRDEAQAALAREVRAERVTSLDYTIERFAKSSANGLRIDLSQVKVSRYALTSVDLLRQRLSVLTQMGLAKQQSAHWYRAQRKSQTWHVSPDFRVRLRELGIRNDIIKQLHLSLGATDARRAAEISHTATGLLSGGSLPSSVRGLLVTKTALDEQSDERLIAVQGSDGRPQYARIWATPALDVAEIGSVVEIGRSVRQRWSLAREIASVAKSNEQLTYSTGTHREWLRKDRPSLSAEQIERRLRRFSKSVARLARVPDSGIRPAAANSVQVDIDVFEQFTTQRTRRPDVLVRAGHSLESQRAAEAYTWLDRQIIRTRLSETLSKNDITRIPAVHDAMVKRADWLVQRGFAERDSESKGDIPIRFHFGATEKLKALEHQDFARRCKERGFHGVHIARAREILKGRYHGMAYLHQGTFGLVAVGERLFAAPISREPRLESGEPVIAKVVDGRHTTWERPGSRNPTKSMGMDR